MEINPNIKKFAGIGATGGGLAMAIPGLITGAHVGWEMPDVYSNYADPDIFNSGVIHLGDEHPVLNDTLIKAPTALALGAVGAGVGAVAGASMGGLGGATTGAFSSNPLKKKKNVNESTYLNNKALTLLVESFN